MVERLNLSSDTAVRCWYCHRSAYLLDLREGVHGVVAAVGAPVLEAINRLLSPGHRISHVQHVRGHVTECIAAIAAADSILHSE